LRAIETRTFYRVGGVRKVEVNTRIVAATNRNLETVQTDGSFRSDLLYRINSFQIALPLRERTDDIELIARHLLKHLGASAFELTPEALNALKNYGWPGNVRQLRNCLERAVLLANDNRITLNELPPEVARPLVTAANMPLMTAPRANNSSNDAASNGSDASTSSNAPTPASLREVERQQISPRSNKRIGIAAKPPKSSVFLPQLSIAACAITVWINAVSKTSNRNSTLPFNCNCRQCRNRPRKIPQAQYGNNERCAGNKRVPPNPRRRSER
jgi:DNA-binding NtrC family response regulator